MRRPPHCGGHFLGHKSVYCDDVSLYFRLLHPFFFEIVMKMVTVFLICQLLPFVASIYASS